MEQDVSFRFSTAIWRCDYEGRLTCFEGDMAFDKVLGNSHRKSGLHFHDVLMFCLQRNGARSAIREFQTFIENVNRNGPTARKLQDIVLLDGTFVRQNVICMPYTGISVIWTEVSDIRSEAVKYRRQANHDPLTGLLNRRGFELSVAGYQKGTRGLQKCALVVIDLDNFKAVNDKFGHDSGDRVLIHVADSLRQVFGAGALIARIGGDEFAVLCFSMCEDFELNRAAKQLNRMVRENTFAPGVETGLGVSLGAVELGDRSFASVTEMLREADLQLYASKRAGKGQIKVYQEDWDFEYYFQPVVSAASQEIVGFEALLRSNRPEDSGRPIHDILADLETSGTLTAVERHCIAQVPKAFAEVKERTGQYVEFSVNLSQAQWEDPNLIKWLCNTLDKGAMPYEMLRIELLEDIQIARPPCQVRENLVALEKLGVSVDLDDFGLSNASLERLTLPAIGRVKIARVMVAKYWDDLGSRRIVDAIISVAKTMGNQIVVEGIEEDWQREVFATTGCAFFQGNYFSKPLSMPDLTQNLSNNTPKKLPTSEARASA